MREPTYEQNRPETPKKAADRALADAGAEEAMKGGSIIRPAPMRYDRAFGERPGAEPTQDFSDLELVHATLKLIGRTMEQVDITRGRQAILINDDGNRATVQLDIGDTPEVLRPRMEAALAKIPERWKPEDVARDMQAQLAAQAEAQAVEHEQQNLCEHVWGGHANRTCQKCGVEAPPPPRFIKGERKERGGLIER